MSVENETSLPDLKAIGLDIEALKQTISQQKTTDINDRLLDEKVVATKFESEELTNLKQEVTQIYLIDLSESTIITEAWVKGLNNMIICTDLSEFNSEETNKGRLEQGLADLAPDTALALRIKTMGEIKVLFIGYTDSFMSYELLSNYVKAVKNAKLYIEKDNELKEVKRTDINGMRVRL